MEMRLKPLTREDLFLEISRLAEDEGIGTREAWDELVDEVIDGHIDLGELDSAQNTEEMKEVLRGRWEEHRNRVAI